MNSAQPAHENFSCCEEIWFMLVITHEAYGTKNVQGEPCLAFDTHDEEKYRRELHTGTVSRQFDEARSTTS